jgi:galactose-1-phosphate uridylyltransferase
MQELQSIRNEHDTLVQEKYEESLKLSIMAKESEITESSKKKKKDLKKKAVGIIVKKGFGAVFKKIKKAVPSMEQSLSALQVTPSPSVKT